MNKPVEPLDPIDELIDIMKRLRTPRTGCPWDLEQTFATIAPYTIEEAYEVADAIAKGDMPHLREELGDLLFQVIFHARMAEESGHFDFWDVVRDLNAKMVRRHPHVFPEQAENAPHIRLAGEQIKAWEAQKAAERAAKSQGHPSSVLDGVILALPALMRAVKLQNRAARVGFDWPSLDPVFAKLLEEWQEFQDAIAEGESQDRLIEEYGDLLFVMANIARHLQIDPEEALRQANAKFERRFKKIEQRLMAMGKQPEESSLEEMDALWDVVKREEKP